jgi:hypothetical protein
MLTEKTQKAADAAERAADADAAAADAAERAADAADAETWNTFDPCEVLQRLIDVQK